MKLFLLFGIMMLCTAPVLAAAPSATQATVTLAPVRGSKQHGTAVLTQRGNKLVVAIHMSTPHGAKMQESGSPMMMKTASLGAHIHRGSCPAPEKQPVYPLNPVTNGSSTTTLTNTSLDKLTSGDYTISVHKSAQDKTNPIACGDIKLANPTGTTQ